MDETNEFEKLCLKDQLNSLEQEARMVLPGIQALFGFQLVAVFSQGFKTDLSSVEQRLHYLAIALSAISAMAVLTPAAFHRESGRDRVEKKFIKVSGRFLLIGMIFLCTAIALDFFLIGAAIGISLAERSAFAATLLAGYLVFWFLYPLIRGGKQRSREDQSSG